MATERIATFVQIYKVDQNNRATSYRRYHNSKPGIVIVENGQRYSYLPFIYSGATVSRTGDNVTAELTLGSNDIVRASVAELVEQNYRADVQVFRMSEDFKHARQMLSTETWLIASAAYDPTACQISLSSGIDAVNASVPRRVLTSAVVGPLPVPPTFASNASPRDHRDALSTGVTRRARQSGLSQHVPHCAIPLQHPNTRTKTGLVSPSSP